MGQDFLFVFSGQYVDKFHIVLYAISTMIKEVFPMRKNAERSHITERKKKPMKKFLWFAAVLVLLCMTQAFAESEATPSVLPQATETPTPLVAASDECLHLNIYVVSDLKTHCEFENASHHIIVA